jgi:hypothetical protein
LAIALRPTTAQLSKAHATRRPERKLQVPEEACKEKRSSGAALALDGQLRLAVAVRPLVSATAVVANISDKHGCS